MTTDEDRAQALTLLETAHAFPGPYVFRVVVRRGREPAVISALASALPETGGLDVTERPSRNGNYVALRMRLTVGSADDVLDTYQVLKTVDGVLTVL